MGKFNLILLVVCLLIILFSTLTAKHKAMALCENNNDDQIESLSDSVEDTPEVVEDTSEVVEAASEVVESASKSNEKFYKKMTEMERYSTLVFNGFPTCLTDILILRKQPGDEIFSTKIDTLYLLYRDLDRYNMNKYVYYLLKDNHGNLWSLFRHNETFRLTREDETKHKNLLEGHPETTN